MADTLANLVVKLEAQTAQYDENLQRANKQLAKFRRNQKTQLEQISDGFKTMATGVAAGAAAAAAGFGVMYARQAETITQLGQVSDRLDITTQDLQAFQLAGESVGVTTDQINDALKDMVERIGDAAVGGGEAREVFDQLGISLDTLYALDTAGQFEYLGEAIQGMGTAADRTAAVMKVFGEAGYEALAVFGSGAIDQARQDIEALGLAIDRVDVAQIEAANASFTRFRFLVDGIQQQLAIVAAPYLQVLTDELVLSMSAAGGLHQALGDMFANAVEWVGDLYDKFNVWRRGMLLATSAIYGASKAWHEFRGNAEEAQHATEMLSETNKKLLDLLDNPDAGADFAERVRASVERSAEIAAEINERQEEIRNRVSGAPAPIGITPEQQGEALNNILAYLQSEEEAIAESYFNRREIVLENTELTELERQFLLDELRAAYEEEKAELELERAAEKAANEDSIRATNLAKEQAYWDQFNKIAGVAQNKYLKMFETWKRSEDASWIKHTQFAAGVISSLTSHFGKESGAMFEISKAVGIAMAIVNTAQGVTAALKLGVVGIPLAAVIAAAGAVEIATIASTSPGGGGGGGSSFSGGGAGGVSPGTPAEIETPDLEPERSAQDVNIVVEPGIYDSNSVRDLIVAINEELSDGIDLNVRVG